MTTGRINQVSYDMQKHSYILMWLVYHEQLSRINRTHNSPHICQLSHETVTSTECLQTAPTVLLTASSTNNRRAYCQSQHTEPTAAVVADCWMTALRLL